LQGLDYYGADDNLLPVVGYFPLGETMSVAELALAVDWGRC